VLAIAVAAVCSLAPVRGWAESARSRESDAEARRLLGYQLEVARATLLVLGESCTGFVAEDPRFVVTAAHCIPYPKRRVDLRLPAGETLVARLDRIDRDTDMALLRLAEPLHVIPLRLSERVPAPGARLMFVGRSDRGNRAQLARVNKLDRCPSLPTVPNALFTSVQARPGDSGAPLVDTNLRVVGLVHGGARCHIAAPVATLAKQLAGERRTVFAGLEPIGALPSEQGGDLPYRWVPLALPNS